MVIVGLFTLPCGSDDIDYVRYDLSTAADCAIQP